MPNATSDSPGHREMVSDPFQPGERVLDRPGEGEAVAELARPTERRARRSRRSRSGSCRVGRGLMQPRSMRSKRPSKVTSGSVHSRRSSPICSSSRSPRVANSCPRASYSTQFQPDPHAEAHPPAREQIGVGGLLGDEHGLALRQDQDARRRARCVRVTPARYPNATNGSWNGSSLGVRTPQRRAHDRHGRRPTTWS